MNWHIRLLVCMGYRHYVYVLSCVITHSTITISSTVHTNTNRPQLAVRMQILPSKAKHMGITSKSHQNCSRSLHNPLRASQYSNFRNELK